MTMDLAFRSRRTEHRGMGLVMPFIVLAPMVLTAWLKVGPIAGLAATALYVGAIYVSYQRAGQLFGSGPYSSPRDSRSHSDVEPEARKSRRD